MTKSDRQDRNRNNEGYRKNSNDKNGGGQSRHKSEKDRLAQKAILHLKRVKRNSDSIKATFKDSDDNQVKELIPTISDGDPKEYLIHLIKRLISLGNRYELFEDGKWQQLAQHAARAMDGEYLEAWDDLTDRERNWNTGNQKKRFMTMCQKLCKKRLGKHYLDN